jgi:hypothetical protein
LSSGSRCFDIVESLEESLEQLLASGLLLGFGVIVLALQGGPEAVQTQAGHASIESTRIY